MFAILISYAIVGLVVALIALFAVRRERYSVAVKIATCAVIVATWPIVAVVFAPTLFVFGGSNVRH